MSKDYWFWNDIDWSLSVPYGWQTRFLEANDAILAVLANETENARFSVIDVKEKYGELRMYYTDENISDGALALIEEIISSMRVATSKICPYCGKRAKYRTTGYIIPLCEECKENKSFLIYGRDLILIEEDEPTETEEPFYKITPKGALYLALMDYSFTDGEITEIWEAFTSTLDQAGYCICDKTGESDDV